MSKEQYLENKDKALHIGRVIISLPRKERIEMIFNAMKENVNKRKEQGFPMTPKKRQMYEMGFEDAIEWVLGGHDSHYLNAVKEFGLKIDYSHEKDGRKFLEVFAQDGKIKLGEWCRYEDGTFNFR